MWGEDGTPISVQEASLWQRNRFEVGFLGWGLFLPGMESSIYFCILSFPLHLPTSLRRVRRREGGKEGERGRKRELERLRCSDHT